MRFLPRFSPRRLRFWSVTLPCLLGGLALLWATGAFLQSADQPKTAAPLELRPGERICLLGNTLADRLQHDGWLETYFQSRFPKHDLTFRNLGFSGDELTLRLRSANFGSPDQWLKFCKADVVFAFFGYNESFAGEAGLGKFKKDLDAFLKGTLNQQYNGQSNPRLVLFSPIAHEDLHDRNLPDGKENNRRLRLYTDAMAEVAKDNKVVFVDLFSPTLNLNPQFPRPLTINGVHLNEKGNEVVAQLVDRALFPNGSQPKRDPQTLEKIRKAVIDKDFHWFNRYRTTDGYSIYGGRADLAFVGGQTNRVVAQREMEVLDVMTANRDKRVWAAASGVALAPRAPEITDDNTPSFIPVKTNKPGPLAGGAHLFLNGEDAIQKMTVAKNMKVTLFASEREFPELAKPVQMAFDAKGRLWVAVWPSYPHWKPKDEMNDKILILEDTDGDGKADKCTVFADKLHNPTGFEFTSGGVLVAQAPDLLLLKDTDGDGKADLRVRVLHGLCSADTHHTANSFTRDPGGAIYFQEGTFHHTQVETPYGPPQRCANAGVFRYEPRTQKFDVYVTYGFANPHGHVFDRWGQDFVFDGTGANPFHAALFSGHLPYPQKHNRPPQVYQQRTRPLPAVEILSSRHFPEANQGNLLVANVIGFQGILQYKFEDKGSSFGATEQEVIVSSTDPHFRPSDLKMGPDGAIWFIDWQNPIIGHMQHNLRDPSRDQKHGRVYRITHENRPLLQPVKIAGEPIEKLLDLLKEPEDRTRYRARIELGDRNTEDVLAAVKKWLADLDPKARDYELHRTEGLWVFQLHNVVNEDLLKRVLAAKEFRARAAATRVLCYWRDRVGDALELLKKQAGDEHPRVRLEAIRAASFFNVAEAIEVVLIADERESDQYLDYTRGETMRVLEPHVTQAIKEGREIKFTTTAGARFFLKNVGIDDLLKMKRSQGVYLELLFRKGVREEFRREALAGLAKLANKNEVQVLVEAVRSQDEQHNTQDESVIFDLIRLLTNHTAAELTAVRPDLEKMAASARSLLARELGYVALITADNGTDKAWALASKSVSALQDLVNAMPLIRDPGLRASLYPKVEPLLIGLPKELQSKETGKILMGRYVRIELPGKQRTLTLAEVEIISDGKNVARQGKATQKNTSHGGHASKAIDGNKSGKYGDGGQTHSEEGTDNPWWEVDLVAEFPISAIVIYNRSDGLGSRLNGYTLKVLNGKRNVVFERQKQPSPLVKAAHEVGSDLPERVIRRAAMNALVSVRGQEEATVKALAPFVKDEADRHAAIQTLLRIPVAYWPKPEAQPVLDNLLGYIRKIPTQERTSTAALDAMQLADNLASLLPLAEAKVIRKELGELGVRVIRIGTVVEQMRYDKERIVVKAGKPVEIVLENHDLMPHNLVVIQPGSLEEVGLLAEATATQPGALERQYVPSSTKVLHASRLLQPRESEKIAFTAPTQPGVYPIVCTYPGHWRRMFGAMYVVEDLDEYLADPEVYLTKHPLKIMDELLKFIRPRKEWKLDELAGTVEQLASGRSFTNAKNLFQIASCISCHKMSGVGNEFGPDLTKIDPKQDKPLEILRDILDPSFRINEKFATYIFDLKSGKTVTGLILEETPETVKLIENPLAKTPPVVLKKADIEERKKSQNSLMPKGLLDKLTHEEILDLIAYVAAKGDPKHRLFQGGHDHGHKHGH